jgi:DNA-directed RNA polymerase sigma subunit (sigma70/sigma32)
MRIYDNWTLSNAAIIPAECPPHLDPRDWTILQRRLQNHPLRTIAADLGISAERIRQIEGRALSRLRWRPSSL